MVTPAFVDRLQLQQDGAGWWVLLSEFRFDSAVLGARVIVPAGFRTNLASVPRIPLAYWLAGGTAQAAAVLHDYLYRTKLFARVYADAVFYEATETDGSAVGIPAESAWRRWIMWAMLRVFGGSAYRTLMRRLRARGVR